MPSDESDPAPENKRPDRWKCPRDLNWSLSELILDTAEWLDGVAGSTFRLIFSHPPRLVPPMPFAECNWAYESYKYAEYALQRQGSAEATESEAYEWLRANGWPGQAEYELPSTFETWVRQVHDGTPRAEHPCDDPRFVNEKLASALASIPGDFDLAIEKCQVDEKPAMAQALIAIRDELLNTGREVMAANMRDVQTPGYPREGLKYTWVFLDANISVAVGKLRRLSAGLTGSERKPGTKSQTINNPFTDSRDAPRSRSSSRFAIALSFPGERRDFVEHVASCLAGQVGQERVLYDKYHEAEFARINLDTHLQQLYHDESELIVVFLCSDYDKKEWCGLEWRAIRDLLKGPRKADVMLLRFDDATIPGLYSIDGYISIGDRPSAEISDLILQRLGSSRTGNLA